MKRKIMSIMMMVAMLFSMNITAFAVDRIGAPIAHAMRSSSYLDSYSVGIEARGNGTIAVTMTVDGKGNMGLCWNNLLSRNTRCQLPRNTDSLCAKQQRLRHRVYHFLYCGLQVNTKYTKEAGSLCRGRGFLLVNFLTALSDIQPCFSPWVQTPKPLTSISSSTGIVRYLRPSITRVSSR